jgi:hypothetical protein
MVFTTGVVVAEVVVYVVLPAGVAIGTGFVVVVVVVITVLFGAGGGGAETTCDSGSVAQPARKPRTPQHAATRVNCLAARAEAERDRRVGIVSFIA